MKYLKLFEEFEPMISPEIANMTPDAFKRKKDDTEFKNKINSDSKWLSTHPLTGVKCGWDGNIELIPRDSKWHLNDNGSFGYSVNFNEGEEYINVYTETPNNINTSVKLGYAGVVGKDELMSWIHSNMVHYNIPTLLKEKIFKELDRQIKEWRKGL